MTYIISTTLDILSISFIGYSYKFRDYLILAIRIGLISYTCWEKTGFFHVDIN